LLAPLARIALEPEFLDACAAKRSSSQQKLRLIVRVWGTVMAARSGADRPDLEPEISAGRVFDLELPLEEAAAGYQAMDSRQAIKVLLRP
jgi:hypothetical protein